MLRVFIIDTGNMGPELQGGLIGVVGSPRPSPEEKNECVETISRYAMDGWAISADPFTPIGRLAAVTAEATRVPLVRLDGARLAQHAPRTMRTTRSPERDSADLNGSPFPAAPETCIGGAGLTDSRIENGGASRDLDLAVIGSAVVVSARARHHDRQRKLPRVE